jgi:hypothetical protein
MHWLDRAAGAMFIAFGLKLAFTDNPFALGARHAHHPPGSAPAHHRAPRDLPRRDAAHHAAASWAASCRR